jgi:hypothetical protein
MPPIITEYLQFFTATNLEWKRLLKPDKYKDIISVFAGVHFVLCLLQCIGLKDTAGKFYYIRPV